MIYSRKNEKDMVCLFLVVPCYNEEEIIEDSNKKIINRLHRLIEAKVIDQSSRVLYVDDGSRDRTWELIRKLSSENADYISAIRLARNEGHQNALMAGMQAAYEHCDVVVTIDADLQQDIEVLDEFIQKYKEGNEIVFGIRKSRNTDTFGKKISANLFYHFMNFLGTKTIKNHADYRLMSKMALTALFEYGETQLFLRGIIATMGFKSDTVYFEVKQRTAGKTKYSLGKMLSLAINGITSLSIKPLHMVFYLGIGVLFISIIMIIRNLYIWSTGIAVSGWTSILCSLWALGGAFDDFIRNYRRICW